MEMCKVCGALVSILTEVHCSKHNLTKEEYRKKYGDNSTNEFSYGRNNRFDKKSDLFLYYAKKRYRMKCVKGVNNK